MSYLKIIVGRVYVNLKDGYTIINDILVVFVLTKNYKTWVCFTPHEN